MQEVNYQLPSGTEIAEFRIIEVLGEGGFGITYKAEDTRLNRLVAIKEFLPVELAARGTDSRTVMPRTNVADDYKYGLKKFLDEARTLAGFNHPNIVKILTFLELNGTAYLVMEYVEGEALDDHLKKIHFNGKMAESRIREIIEPILKGLAQVHKAGLLHRDIKPGNIYLQNSHEEHGNNPMLIDFGAARQSVGEKSKSISAIISQGYAPPEQYTTRGKQGPYTDLYAIGAVMYYLVTGVKPVESTDRQHDVMGGEPDPLTPIENDSYSDSFKACLTQTMELIAKKRCQTVQELQQILSGEVIPAQTEDADATVKIDHQAEKAQVNKANKEKTAVDKKLNLSANIETKSKAKSVVFIALVVALSVAGFFGYQQYEQNKQQEQQAKIAAQQKLAAKKLAEEKATSKENKILYVQKSLKQLGFQSPIHGQLDRRTQKAIEAFEQSQKMLVTGEVDDLLMSKLEVVVEQERLNAIKQKDDANWADAKMLSSINSFQNYINQQPNGLYISQAEKRIDNINWAMAKKANTVNSYQTYLTTQTIGEFTREAHTRIDNIRWALAKKTNTVDSYQTYIEQQPSGSYIIHAEDGITTVKVENTKVALTINVVPKSAKITLAGTSQQYIKGVRLLPKKYQVTLSKFGYSTKKTTIDLTNSKSSENVTYELESNMPKVIGDIINTLVDIPSGSFIFGCSDQAVCQNDEKPARNLTIDAFKLMSTEVTFEMWDICVQAKGCSHKPNNEGWGLGNHPVINVSYNDITQEFIPWLNNVTDGNFRLPSEAEWEYAARAGSTSQYLWGEKVKCDNAHYGTTTKLCDYATKSKPVKSYKANKYGLYDMQGNVWEWVQDCWNPNHKGATSDGQARMTGDCKSAIRRGGSWKSVPKDLRSANRDWFTRGKRGIDDGFRLAYDK